MNTSFDQHLEIKDIKNLERFARDFISALSYRQIVLLVGPLGVGKTKFVECLVKACGFVGVSSPTFAIHQSYQTPKGIVDHLDLYRLQGDADIQSTGVWDLFDQDTGLILIEWGDRLELEQLPRDWNVIRLNFSFNKSSETARDIAMERVWPLSQ